MIRYMPTIHESKSGKIMTSSPKIIAITARTGLETVTPIRLSPLFTVSVIQKNAYTKLCKKEY